MQILNYEFKARTTRLKEIEERLLTLNPVFKGTDLQVDTYFNVPDGRLKLREGNIENSLIYYKRENIAGAKQSEVLLYKHNPDKSLKEILVRSNGIKIIVEKQRLIYFIANIKFHFDTIADLGTFVEVEAIDATGEIGIERLQAQCNYYADFLEIKEVDYVSESYSDLILKKVFLNKINSQPGDLI